MASTMTTIDGKLGQLEKMYDDVNTLSGHVGVMSDEVQKVKQPKIPVSRKKRVNINLTNVQTLETPVCMPKQQETTFSTDEDKQIKLSKVLVEMDAIDNKINDLDSMHSEAQVLIGQATILEKQIEHLSKYKSPTFGNGANGPAACVKSSAEKESMLAFPKSSGLAVVIPDPIVPSKKRSKLKDNIDSKSQKVIDQIQESNICSAASEDVTSTTVNEQISSLLNDVASSPVNEQISLVTSSANLVASLPFVEQVSSVTPLVNDNINVIPERKTRKIKEKQEIMQDVSKLSLQELEKVMDEQPQIQPAEGTKVDIATVPSLEAGASNSKPQQIDRLEQEYIQVAPKVGNRTSPTPIETHGMVEMHTQIDNTICSYDKETASLSAKNDNQTIEQLPTTQLSKKEQEFAENPIIGSKLEYTSVQVSIKPSMEVEKSREFQQQQPIFVEEQQQDVPIAPNGSNIIAIPEKPDKPQRRKEVSKEKPLKPQRKKPNKISSEMQEIHDSMQDDKQEMKKMVDSGLKERREAGLTLERDEEGIFQIIVEQHESSPADLNEEPSKSQTFLETTLKETDEEISNQAITEVIETSRQDPVDQRDTCQMQLLGIQDDQNSHSQSSHISHLKEELTKFATESPQISSLKKEIKNKVKQDTTEKIEKMQEMKEEFHQIQEKTMKLSNLSDKMLIDLQGTSGRIWRF